MPGFTLHPKKGHRLQKFIVRIASIKQETPTIKSFTLDYGQQAFQFLAGQWIDLSVEIAGKVETGGYSMTSSPLKKGTFELAIKQGARHPVTRFMYEQAQEGDTVTVSTGQGVFVYVPGMGEKIVLIGAGVGVTPLMSILRFVDDAALEVDATLVYSIPTADEFLFRTDLQQIEARNPHIQSLITVTQPDLENWQGRTGRIDSELLKQAGLSHETMYYLCGPQLMIEDVVTELKNIGVPESRIVYEKWW